MGEEWTPIRKRLAIGKLVANKGQILGVPKNPRLIKDIRYRSLVKSIQDDPEMLELREVIAVETSPLAPLLGKERGMTEGKERGTTEGKERGTTEGKEEYVVIAGNMRLQACKELGYKTVPCKILPADTPAEKLRAYAIKDNNEWGEWDFDLLANDWEVTELKEWGMEEELSFIEDIDTDLKQGETDDDEVPEPPKVAISKPGDLWLLGRHRLLCGDATKREDVERLMDGKSINDITLFTDPPYGIDYDPQWLSDIHVAKGTKPNKAKEKIINDQGQIDLSFLLEYNKRLIWGFPYTKDFTATGWIVWDKQPQIDWRTITTPVEIASTTLRKGFDLIHCMWAGYLRDKMENEERGIHPTQKPLKVIYGCVEKFVKTDVLIDLFIGSGTTLIACEKTNRVCYGLEIEPLYCDVTIKRWQDFTGQEAVREDGKKWNELI